MSDVFQLTVSMDRHTDSHQFQRLEVVDTGRRRRWSAAEKYRIVEESFSAPRLVSVTARRYGMSPSQLFAWRKEFREGPARPLAAASAAPAMAGANPSATFTALEAGADRGRMEIVSSHGRRVIVGPDVDPSALARILDVLERRR